ncbi:hypothetical protein D9Q98_005025 [Chlorella vulgaris]|uniref:Uncharacterized protein n=1 Tax=Chlorella vulgaris TaxID=3077 RepID=A0A9D4TNH7_CHLVU|nr:hypothetical protein D9Q98_005025 [Chlorella vulgaris]
MMLSSACVGRSLEPVTGWQCAASSNSPGSDPPTSQHQQAQRHGLEQPLPPFRLWPATAQVALRTGVYIGLFGLATFCLPGATFGVLFDSRLVTEGWVRVGGVLATLFGWYYVGAALDDAAGRTPRCFYSATTSGRLFLSVAFAGLVAAKQCEPALLWLAAANLVSSLTMWRAVRQRVHAERHHVTGADS